jgi:alpha-2-macroglobulin
MANGQRAWGDDLRGFVQRSRLLAAASMVLAACVAGSSAPVVAPTGVVAPRAEEAPEAASTLEVVFAGPKGAAAPNSVPQVVFNQPLRELSAAEPPSLGLTIEPAQAGTWQWVGARALRFVPELSRLPAATHYRVTVPAGITALSGLRLAAPLSFEFETPRPAVVSVYPSDGEEDVELDAPIYVTFNQPVDAAAVGRHVRLSAKVNNGVRELPVSVRRARDEQGKEELERVVLRVAGGLPRHARIELEVAAGSPGREGPLPSAEAHSSSFQTYGPLVVKELGCVEYRSAGCDPELGLRVELSNDVIVADLKRALKITPPASVTFPSWAGDTDTVRSIDLNGKLPPRARFELALAADLKDSHGQSLGAPVTRGIVVADYPPRATLGMTGEVLQAPTPALALGTLNVGKLELWTRALAPSDLAAYYRVDGEHGAFAAVVGLPTVARSEVFGKLTNAVQHKQLNLAELLPAGKGRGALALGWSYLNERGEPVQEGRLLQATDLALTAKLSREGSWVWVTRLSSAEPVKGAEVQLLASVPPLSKRYVTDAAGAVHIPASDFAPELHPYDTKTDAVLVAAQDGDSTFCRVREFIDTWRIDAPVDFEAGAREYGLLFSERGIYRPGEAVLLKGVVRREQAAGNAVVSGRGLEVVLFDPNGEEVAAQPVTTNAFGTFATEFKLPRTSGLGGFQLSTRGLSGGQASTMVQVAEYRAAEFSVKAEAARSSYVRGQKAHFDLTADYLYGAPMSGAAARYSVSRQPTWFSPPGTEGYSTSDEVFRRDLEQASIPSAILAQARTALGAHGELAVDVPLALPAQVSPESIRLDADVTDISRQSIGGGASVLVHPAAFYVGVGELEDWFQPAPGKLQPRIVTVTPEGKRVVGRRVALELVRRHWALSRTESDGSYQTIAKPVDEAVGQCTVITKAEPQTCALELKESGYYLLLASAQDEKGNPTRSALAFYALGAGRASWSDNDQRKLELVPNKPQYRVGESARLLIKSPFPRARALVTLERSGVQEARWVTLDGPTPTVDVPITSEMRPNIYVSVLVEPPSTGGKAEPGYRLGYTNLVIDPEERRLKVSLQTFLPNAKGDNQESKEFRPGDTVQAALSVRDAQGRGAPAEVTVYAVDEGVLSLVGYQPPDPIAVFSAARPLSVGTLETRDALGQVFLPDLAHGMGANKGQEGGGGGDGEAMRGDFRTSAYFNPEVLTDAQGQARVQFKLPDNLTTFRLMAVAVSKEDRYGFASTSFVVNKPLMARPALPRFLRVGDRLEAGVVVSARGIKPGPVRVAAELSGVTLLGPAEQTLNLDANGSAEARFPIAANDVGKARFAFRVSAAHAKDGVEVTRDVDNAVALETAAVYGQTQAAEAQALGDLSALRADVGGISMSLASTALVGLDEALHALGAYPYGCTEQLASRLLPLGPLRELAQVFGKAPGTNPLAEMEALVAEILERQAGDGGFLLWPSSRETEPWVSAYALWVLGEAKRAGVAIPARVFDSGRSYLRQYLNGARERPEFLVVAPFALDVLSALGEPDLGTLGFVFERKQALPTFAKALLLRAAVQSRAGAAMVSPLRHELEARVALRGNQADVDLAGDQGYPELFDSALRSHALVLWALVAAEPKHRLAAPLALGLLEVRRRKGWQGTQESAYALLALDAYRRAQEAKAPSFEVAVWLGKERLLDQRFKGNELSGVQHDVPMAVLARASGEQGKGGQPLVFDKKGEGTLFYEARLTYARQKLPTSEVERGFYVRKTLRAVPPERLDEALALVPDVGESRFGPSALVLTDLVVIAPALRHHVVLDDPLPAGFEAVDTNLQTTAGDYGDALAASAETGFEQTWFRQELRDARALFFIERMPAGIYHYRYLARATSLGKFVVPPTRVHEMYQPEVYGQSPTTYVEVE